jgi:hypothetical protein
VFSSSHLVEVFSAGWHPKSVFQRHEASPVLSIEFLPDIYDYNEYLVTWLELSRRPPIAEGIGTTFRPFFCVTKILLHSNQNPFAEDCQFTCPELHACVNASIWCDSKVHCPSGYDESFIRCSRILRLPAEILAVLCGFIIFICCAASFYIRRLVASSLAKSFFLD